MLRDDGRSDFDDWLDYFVDCWWCCGGFEYGGGVGYCDLGCGERVRAVLMLLNRDWRRD